MAARWRTSVLAMGSPAIASAMYAAGGVRLDALPISPETVLRALRGADDSDG
jgi:CO/xanthine dehydrogenase Mo-binding subunit